MDVWYRSDRYGILCFRHAVKEVIENNADITPYANTPDPNDCTGCFDMCQKCTEEYDKEYKIELEDEDEE